MYYPLAKITPNLYTSGNEFAIASTGKDYKGYYFSTYDGRYFTNSAPGSDSAELVKYSSGVGQSLSSLKYSRSEPSQSSTGHYTPLPTQEEYDAGYMLRYFIKRVNGDSSTIRELSREDFNAIQRDPLYNSTMLMWRLTGLLEDTPLSGNAVMPGVITLNTNTIKLGEKFIPGISQYLTNITQFYR